MAITFLRELSHDLWSYIKRGAVAPSCVRGGFWLQIRGSHFVFAPDYILIHTPWGEFCTL